ncbi:helix-turn-helix transcriptional regulator [Pseudobacillus badius]|uniref:helix-turn-helix transcriptional regulator n=1 Tax=Bacillus badius TaxID=1455 RepID=UPI00255451D7|nr:helix-turn-helix transcriptional regulator [Bacillus badius]
MVRLWLKELRLQRTMTQNEVAEKSGVERAYYTMIELGSRNPSVEVAKNIAHTLGFNWTIFFENQCNKTKQNKGVS